MKSTVPRVIIGKSLFLLIFLLVFVMISSVLDIGQGFTHLFYIVLFISILSATYAVAHNKYILIFDSILAIGIVAANFLTIFYQEPWFYAVICILAFLFSFVTAVGILLEILSKNDITLDKIYAATAVYLLLGMAWGFLYLVIEILFPGSFMSQSMTIKAGTIAHQMPSNSR